MYRYFLRSYRYELVRREDGSLDPDFVITELFGNRVRVVCRVSLADLCEIVPISSQKNKKENGGAVFCYTARMGRQDAYRMTLRDGEETVSVIFESDRRLFELLSQK